MAEMISYSVAATGFGVTSTSLVIQPPPVYTAGNLLVMGVTAGGASLGSVTPNLPSGWTRISAPGAVLGVFTKVATASESSVTITLTGTSASSAFIAAYPAGTVASSLFAASGTDLTTYSPAFPTGVTSGQTVLLVGAVCYSPSDPANNAGYENYDFPAGWTPEVPVISPPRNGAAVLDTAIGLCDIQATTGSPQLTSNMGSNFYTGFLVLNITGSAPPVMAVTATATGNAQPGVVLSVRALTGAATVSAISSGGAKASSYSNGTSAAPSQAITATGAGSLIYGAVTTWEPGAAFTPLAGTTFQQNINDSNTSEGYGLFKASGAATVGASAPANTRVNIAAAEILAASGHTLAEVLSADVAGTAYSQYPSTAVAQTAYFVGTVPAPGDLLVATVAVNSTYTQGTAPTVSITDSSSLNWVPLVQSNAVSGAYAGVFIAQVPASGGGGGGGVPVVIQSKEILDAASGSFSSPVGAGNTVVVVITGWSASNVTITTTGVTLGGSGTGFAQAKASQSPYASGETEYAAIWYGPTGSGGQTAVAVTVPNATIGTSDGDGIVIYELSGQLTLDQVISGSLGTGTAVSSGSTPATTQANEIVFGAATSNDILSGYGSGYTNTGMTETWGTYAAAGYKIVSATGAQSYAGTQATSGPWAAVVATFATPAGGTAQGSGGAAADKPSLSAAGSPVITAGGGITVPVPSLAALGVVLDAGPAAVTVPKPSLAAAGTPIGSGLIIPKPSLAGTGTPVNPAVGAISAVKPSLTGHGTVLLPGTNFGQGGITVPAPGLAAQGTPVDPGSGRVRVPKPSLGGSGGPFDAGGGAVLVPKPDLSAQGSTSVAATIAVAVPKPSLRARGRLVQQAGPAASVSAVTTTATAVITVKAKAVSVSRVTSAAEAYRKVFAEAASASAVTTTATALIFVQGVAASISATTTTAAATALYGNPVPATPPRALPSWQRDVQRFAITQERQRHVQALWQYGELAVFALMWTAADNAAGLVGRCLRCFAPAGSGLAAEEQIAAAYGQGNQYACTDCFGTQFEGGYRALIVRPAIFNDMDKGQSKTAKGVMQPGELGIDSTPDFRVRPGDYCFRSTGERFQLRQPRRTTLRTGFASPWQQDTAIDYNQLRASLEDPASVAYQIPPAQAQLAQMLGTYTRVPADFSWFEVIRAPLIPSEEPPPAASARPQPTTTFPPG